MNKDLQDWEAQMRLEIARVSGEAPEVVVPEKPKRVKRPYERRVVLGLSNDRGHTIVEWVHDSKQIMELAAHLEACKEAKKQKLKVHCLLSNTRLK